MALTLDELNNGILYWMDKRNWPNDFHYNFYIGLEGNINRLDLRFTNDLIIYLLPKLTAWRATRPKPNNFIINNYNEISENLRQIWQIAISPILEEDIETVKYDSLRSFVDAVNTIKRVKSPVFTSKFCHFLAPWIFPVVDNAALGRQAQNTYENYYTFAQREWIKTDHQTRLQLMANLQAQIQMNGQLNHYPIKNKVIEICLIGRNHGAVQNFINL